jgi:hypothetical protein
MNLVGAALIRLGLRDDPRTARLADVSDHVRRCTAIRSTEATPGVRVFAYATSEEIMGFIADVRATPDVQRHRAGDGVQVVLAAISLPMFEPDATAFDGVVLKFCDQPIARLANASGGVRGFQLVIDVAEFMRAIRETSDQRRSDARMADLVELVARPRATTILAAAACGAALMWGARGVF